MPDSQRQRPGAKLVPSHEEKVRDLLQRAKTLESELSTAGKSDEEKAAQLRSHLCEVISDLIITDPAVSREYDLPTTLWRSCFYFPICSFRKEMSKMKRKKGPTSSTRAFENQFKKFLSEALALYDYLSIQYQSKLIPGHTQVDSQEDAQVPTESESTAGVVEGLYRLFIYTGDLHRYAESFDKATACYQNASKLSPGNGNPYNQLAVVSQVCVGIFWSHPLNLLVFLFLLTSSTYALLQTDEGPVALYECFILVLSIPLGDTFEF